MISVKAALPLRTPHGFLSLLDDIDEWIQNKKNVFRERGQDNSDKASVMIAQASCPDSHR